MKVLQNMPFLPPFSEYTKKIESIWQTKYLTNNGPIENEFVRKLEEIGFNNVATVVNGHMGLEACIDVFDLSGEIITTPFTFASTITAISRRGITPVFADINLNTFNIDPVEIEKKITKKTTAIFAVHVFGVPCEHEAINKIAIKYGLKVIYDAAHSFACTLNGSSISSFGDASVFSLHATKVFHSIEGGLITFNNSKSLDSYKVFRNFGIDGEKVTVPGANFKMHEFSAAMGVVNLDFLNEILEKRSQIFKYYIDRLKNIPEIQLQSTTCDDVDFERNFAYFPIVFKHKGIRDGISDTLNCKGVNVRKYFYPTGTQYDFINTDEYCPNALNISENILTLPLHTHMSISDAKYVCDCLLEALSNV